ncbi:MAG TPA: dienelactone hydrolase family protein [Syntrophomonadaceae bacterium]|nr:dienelactone hydrolase family protein [Syntrophomonadaceae bacterium]
MLTYLNKSDTAILVLHEIYGINQHIKDMCLSLSRHGFDVFAPNMLQGGNIFDYDQEDVAYANFFDCIGFKKALGQVNVLLSQIRNNYKTIFVVGFSVGATIAWLCSETPDLCDGVIGFYGSRIRDYLKIEPKCPVLLIVAGKEKSFNISEFMEIMAAKKNVYVKQVSGSHGFTNPSSPYYDEHSAYQAYNDMILFINNNILSCH